MNRFNFATSFYPQADEKPFHFAERYQGGITYDPIPKCDVNVACMFPEMAFAPPMFHLFISAATVLTVLGLSVVLWLLAHGLLGAKRLHMKVVRQ
ncbi:MAG: hypothetical protein AAGA08_10615 [Pseudomonadota bacterium]